MGDFRETPGGGRTGPTRNEWRLSGDDNGGEGGSVVRVGEGYHRVRVEVCQPSGCVIRARWTACESREVLATEVVKPQEYHAPAR